MPALILDKEASSSTNNAAVDEAVITTSSVDNRVEPPEKVFIDLNSDKYDELIDNNLIATIQQLEIADEEARKTVFKMVSKKCCLYGNSFTDEKLKCLYPEL